MNWELIKKLIQFRIPTANKGMIGFELDAKSEISLYAQIVNEQVAQNQYKFRFQLETTTITLNSTGEYDLKTLIPGFTRLFQILIQSQGVKGN